jgi:TonB-dependent starch-binding outer membrane protein SusC
MKIRLSQLLKICVMLIFTGLSVTSFAQTSVSGKVTDSKDGSPVAGVTVSVKGTKTAVKTDAAGAYTITAATNAPVLVFSSVGFTTQQVTAANGAANVSLIQSNTQLQDVVVVAYGTRKKTDLTGSVVSVGIKDFQKGAINSSEQLLQGKVAGLEVTTGGGAAGGGSRIRIRGGASLNASNDPLIVIDGVPVEGNGVAGSPNYLSTINPNDIESITVLKDAASTALYGSRASNGVLIITTKKGGSGKTVFNFSTKVSIGKVTDYVKVLTGDQVREIVKANGDANFISKLGKENTDWQKAIYQTATGFDNNLSASGGLKLDDKTKIPFRVSAGYLNQGGVLKTNNFQRISTSLNLSPKFLDDHLSVNFAVKYSNTKTRFANEGAIGSAVSMNPTAPVYSSGKNWGGYFETLQPNGFPVELTTRNPLALLELRKNIGFANRLIGNVQLDYKTHFLPDLHVLVNVGMDNSYSRGDDNIDSTAATNYARLGSFTNYKQSKVNKLADVSLFYSKELKNIRSKIDVLAMHSFQNFYTNVSYIPTKGQTGIIDSNTIKTGNVKPEYALESYVGRLNYTYNDKYLLTASIRRDASSKFSKANRIGYFPAVALAWKLKNEFFKNSNLVSDLKLRVSYGQTGNQDGIGYYDYQAVYNPSVNSAAQYQFGNTYYSFLRPDVYNPDLKWESTASTNLGLDFGLFNNRISGSIDIYNKDTKDLLSNVSIAPGANFGINFTKNIGSIKNKGVEVSLNATPIKTNKLTWDFSVNGTYNNLEITKLIDVTDPNFKGVSVNGISGGTGNFVSKHQVGYAPYTYFLKTQVYDVNGKPIEGLFDDIQRDGLLDEGDRNLSKKPTPDFLFGFSTQISYDKFTFGLAGHGMAGNYIYNNFNSGNANLSSIQNAIAGGVIGNAGVNYLDTKFRVPQYLSNYFVENASFFRLDNINLGYNFGKIVNNKASLRLNASIQNVFIITKYSGLDPENAGNGTDNNIYPRPRIYSLGASLDF